MGKVTKESGDFAVGVVMDATADKHKRIQVVSPHNDDQSVELVLKQSPKESNQRNRRSDTRKSFLSMIPLLTSSSDDSTLDYRNENDCTIPPPGQLEETGQKAQLDSEQFEIISQKDTPSSPCHDMRVLEDTTAEFVARVDSLSIEMEASSSHSFESAFDGDAWRSNARNLPVSNEETSSYMSDEHLEDFFQYFDIMSFSSSSDDDDDGLSGEIQAIQELQKELREELENLSLESGGERAETIMVRPVKETRPSGNSVAPKEKTTPLCNVQRALEVTLCCGVTSEPDASCFIQSSQNLISGKPSKNSDDDEHLQQHHFELFVADDPLKLALRETDVPSALNLRICEHKLIKLYSNNPTSADGQVWRSNMIVSFVKDALHAFLVRMSPAIVRHPFASLIWNVVLADYVARLADPHLLATWVLHCEATLHDEYEFRFHQGFKPVLFTTDNSTTYLSDEFEKGRLVQTRGYGWSLHSSAAQELDSCLPKVTTKETSSVHVEGKAQKNAGVRPISFALTEAMGVSNRHLLKKKMDETTWNSAHSNIGHCPCAGPSPDPALLSDLGSSIPDDNYDSINSSKSTLWYQPNFNEDSVTIHCEENMVSAEKMNVSETIEAYEEKDAGSIFRFYRGFQSIVSCGVWFEPSDSDKCNQARARDASYESKYFKLNDARPRRSSGFGSLAGRNVSVKASFPVLKLWNSEYKLLRLHGVNQNSTYIKSRINRQFTSVIQGACHDFLVILSPFAFEISFQTFVWNIALADCVAALEHCRSTFQLNSQNYWQEARRNVIKAILCASQFQSPKALLFSNPCTHEKASVAMRLSTEEKDEELPSGQESLCSGMVEGTQSEMYPLAIHNDCEHDLAPIVDQDVHECYTRGDSIPHPLNNEIIEGSSSSPCSCQPSTWSTKKGNTGTGAVQKNVSASIEDAESENELTLRHYYSTWTRAREGPAEGVRAEFGDQIENLLDMRSCNISNNPVQSPTIKSENEFDFAFQSWRYGSATSNSDPTLSPEPRPEDDIASYSIGKSSGIFHSSSNVSEDNCLFQMSVDIVAPQQATVIGSYHIPSSHNCTRNFADLEGKTLLSCENAKNRWCSHFEPLMEVSFETGYGGTNMDESTTVEGPIVHSPPGFSVTAVAKDRTSDIEERVCMSSSSCLSDLKQKEKELAEMLSAVQKAKQSVIQSCQLTIGIVGFGQFGQFIARTLQKYGRLIVTACADKAEEAKALGTTFVPLATPAAFFDEGVDVVVLAVSIMSFAPTLTNLVPHIKNELTRRASTGNNKSILFVDVLSVKEYPRKLMLAKLPSGCDILCTHPMFGPESGNDGWEGLKFVYEKTRINEIISNPSKKESGEHSFFQGGLSGESVERLDRVDCFLSIWEEEGCQMIPMSCKEHDSYAANQQFLTYLLGNILHSQRLTPTPIDTEEFECVQKLAGVTGGKNIMSLYGLFKFNPESLVTMNKLRKALHGVVKQMNDMENKEKLSRK